MLLGTYPQLGSGFLVILYIYIYVYVCTNLHIDVYIYIYYRSVSLFFGRAGGGVGGENSLGFRAPSSSLGSLERPTAYRLPPSIALDRREDPSALGFARFPLRWQSGGRGSCAPATKKPIC